MRNSWGNPHRNFRGEVVTANASTIDTADLVHRVLAKNYGCLKNGAKFLAKHARATPRAAENWLDGTCTPNSEKLVNIMKNCRELREEIFRLVDEEP